MFETQIKSTWTPNHHFNYICVKPVEDWQDTPENFATIDDYVEYAIQRIQELKEENEQSRKEIIRLMKNNVELLEYIDSMFDEHN